MKRILLFVAPFLLLSCKNNETVKSDQKAAERTVDPTDTIVILNNEVNTTWLKENEAYICGRDANNDIYVGLSLISENTGQTARSSWLSGNGGKINYVESGKYIVGVHRLPSVTGVSLPENSPSLTYGEIKNKINSLANDSGYFEDDKYNQYVKISIDSIGNVNLDLVQYDPNDDCYSIPFLRALEREVPNVTNETVFRFGKYEAKNRRQVVFFKVGDNNRYFNISNKPPFLPETETVKK